MSILDKVKNISSSVLAFEKHPARELDLEQKIHYLNGLALLMNVDENIDEKEKEYLKILLNSFELPVEQLDELIAFSQNPDDEAIQEMLKVLGEAGDIKYVFLLDCLTLAHYDGELHENEKELIGEYGKLLKIDDTNREILESLEKILREKDHPALYRFFLVRQQFEQKIFSYLLDFYNLDMEKIKQNMLEKNKKILVFEFNKVEIKYRKSGLFLGGYVGPGNKTINISRYPIFMSQFILFLQHLIEQKEIVVKNDSVIEEKNGLRMINLADSKISYRTGTFSFEDNGPVTGITSYGIQQFIIYANTLLNKQFKILSFPKTIGFRYDKFDISSFNNTDIKLEKNEFFQDSGDSFRVSLKYEGSGNYQVEDIEKWDKDYTDDFTVFRLMDNEKIEE